MLVVWHARPVDTPPHMFQELASQFALLRRSCATHTPYPRHTPPCTAPHMQVFVLLPFFWMLHLNGVNLWTNQGKRMAKPDWLSPAIVLDFNTLSILWLLPLFDRVLFPFLVHRSWFPLPLKRMVLGMACTGMRSSRSRIPICMAGCVTALAPDPSPIPSPGPSTIASPSRGPGPSPALKRATNGGAGRPDVISF